MCRPIKQPTTYQEQVTKLEERGCIIDDKEECMQRLSELNYYRFSAYFLPFRINKDEYKHGTSFKQVYRIYEFDRKLRTLVLSAIEDIEISLRSNIAYYHAHTYGSIGYMDEANFRKVDYHIDFISKFEREVKNNKTAKCVIHHNEEYGGIFPIWAAVELFTFGMLSQFYSNMTTRDRKKLSEQLYSSNHECVASWLRCCTDLRNACAHYGRLYYRIFPAVPSGFSDDISVLRQLWGAIISVYALYPSVEKWNYEILLELKALIDAYADDIDLNHIGFPADWEKRLTK